MCAITVCKASILSMAECYSCIWSVALLVQFIDAYLRLVDTRDLTCDTVHRLAFAVIRQHSHIPNDKQDRTSSHFSFRCLQVLHPVLVLLAGVEAVDMFSRLNLGLFERQVRRVFTTSIEDENFDIRDR